MSLRNRILILVSNFFMGTGGLAFYTYYPRYLEVIGTSSSLITYIVSMVALAAFIFPPLIGKYSDKLQKRKVFITVGSFASVIMYYLGFLVSIEFVWLAFILIFVNGFFGSSYSMLYPLYSESCADDPKWISYYNAVTALSWSSGAFLSGFLMEFFGIEGIFYLVLITVLLSAIPSLFIVENREDILALNLDSKQDAKKVSDTDEKFDNKTLNLLLLPLFIALLFRNFGIRPILGLAAIFFSFTLNSEAEIGILIGINPLIQAVLTLIIGRIINKKNIKVFMVIGFATSSLAMLGYYVSTDFWGLLISQIMVCISFSFFWNASIIYISQLTTPENKANYVGRAWSFFYLGVFLGNWFMGGLLTVNNNYYFTLLIMMVFPLISVLFILFWFKPKFRDQ